MATRYVDNPTIKKLFADSKGICAKCDTDLFPGGDLVGEICHIEAYSTGGNRYNKLLKKEKKENSYENLIVLCSNCHKTIDLKSNEDIYDKDYLIALKENHKKRTITKTCTAINDDKLEIISNEFSLSIERELAEIKSLLNLITGNHCFKILQEKFKPQRAFLPSIENINSFFFSKADKSIIETVLKGVELNQPQSYILIGPPSSGKTTLMLKIANELPDTFTHFFLSLTEDHTLESITKDLKYIKDFQSIVYLDDCHLNNELACEIYHECKNYLNLTLIFLYREISDVAMVSESGYNLFENTVSDVFRIDPFTNQNEKIKTLIEDRRKKIISTKSIEAKIGDFKTVVNFIDKNLLKLTLLLDEWEKQPNIILDQINDVKLNRLLYNRFLSNRYPKPEQDFLKIYTSINKFEIPFRILDSTNLEKQLLEDALVNINGEQEFEFFHSSFANLLLLSLISEDSKFTLRFPDGYDSFIKNAFVEYLQMLTAINPNKYPYKIPFILNKILVNKGFDLYKYLLRDEEIKVLIVKYFKSVDDYDQFSLFFKNVALSCSNQYNYYYSQIVDNARLNKLVQSSPKNIKDFKTVLFILRDKSYSDYKNAIQKLPKETIKKMILASRLNDVTYTARYIYDFDPKFSEHLIKDITKEEWIFMFNQASGSSISNSAIELMQVKSRAFATEILSEVDSDKIINGSKRETIVSITKLIKELDVINPGLAKRIANSMSEQFISDKIVNQPIGKISKSLQELYPYKKTELSSILSKINDADLVAEFNNYNLSNIGRILSELYDLHHDKISKLVSSGKFQEFLLSKLSVEDNCGYAGKIIADLKKVHPDSAKYFVSKFTFEKLKNLISKSNLEQLSTLLYNIYLTDGYDDLAIKIFKTIPSKTLAKKTFSKFFKITNYDSTFSQLSKVDPEKTKVILNSIEDKILIKKSIDFRVSARKVSQALKSLSFVDSKKINRITTHLFENTEFIKKINDLSKADLIHTYANFLAIDIDKSNAKFKNKIENFIPSELKDEDISTYSDGLKLLNKNIELTKESIIIKTFESHLIENYKHFKLRQISISFINLFSIEQSYASKLIEILDLDTLAFKALEMDSEENLNGCLGEIRTVNAEFWGKLVGKINENS